MDRKPQVEWFDEQRARETWEAHRAQILHLERGDIFVLHLEESDYDSVNVERIAQAFKRVFAELGRTDIKLMVVPKSMEFSVIRAKVQTESASADDELDKALARKLDEQRMTKMAMQQPMMPKADPGKPLCPRCGAFMPCVCWNGP